MSHDLRCGFLIWATGKNYKDSIISYKLCKNLIKFNSDLSITETVSAKYPKRIKNLKIIMVCKIFFKITGLIQWRDK